MTTPPLRPEGTGNKRPAELRLDEVERRAYIQGDAVTSRLICDLMDMADALLLEGRCNTAAGRSEAAQKIRMRMCNYQARQ